MSLPKLAMSRLELGSASAPAQKCVTHQAVEDRQADGQFCPEVDDLSDDLKVFVRAAPRECTQQPKRRNQEEGEDDPRSSASEAEQALSEQNPQCRGSKMGKGFGTARLDDVDDLHELGEDDERGDVACGRDDDRRDHPAAHLR